MFETIKTFCMEGLLMRLVLAMVCGVAMGLDREFKNKRAGVKTYALVCVGAATCMIVSEYVIIARPELTTDASRLGANVVTGVGFLGAATIMTSNSNELRGLTTAAGVWAAGAVGLACGAGAVEIAIGATVVVLFVFVILGLVTDRIYEVSRGFDAYALLKGIDALHSLLDELRAHGVHVSNLVVNRRNDGSVAVTFQATTQKLGQKGEIISLIHCSPGIDYLEHS